MCSGVFQCHPEPTVCRDQQFPIMLRLFLTVHCNVTTIQATPLAPRMGSQMSAQRKRSSAAQLEARLEGTAIKRLSKGDPGKKAGFRFHCADCGQLFREESTALNHARKKCRANDTAVRALPNPVQQLHNPAGCIRCLDERTRMGAGAWPPHLQCHRQHCRSRVTSP